MKANYPYEPEPESILTRTPSRLSGPINSLCGELVKVPAPRYLEVTPEPYAEQLDCFLNVERKIQKQGGTICYGWLIWEEPSVLVEAEFHAVWQDPTGRLHEITPKQNAESRVLFLPDPDRVYEGRQINNVRRGLSQNPNIKKFIKACDEEFELLNKGGRAAQQGQIELIGQDAEEYSRIQLRKANALQNIRSKPAKIGRNTPCPCGSGLKFKKCHGR